MQVSEAKFWSAIAVLTDGAAVCWGSGSFGQLGYGGTKDQNAPVNVVSLLSPIVAISAGSSHTCALSLTDAAL
jgi:alpha-tubulin suppressor-like RCC1 family protein